MYTTDRSYFNMSLWGIFALSPRKLSFAFEEIQDEFSLRKATIFKVNILSFGTLLFQPSQWFTKFDTGPLFLVTFSKLNPL